MADGMASLGIFKHIPCPAGDKCTAFRCLFRHAGDEEAWPLPAQPTEGVHIPVPAGPSQNHEPPQKRVKVTADLQARNCDHPNKSLGLTPNQNEHHQRGENLTTKAEALYDPFSPPANPTTGRKSVSPPPLKRKEPIHRKPGSNFEAETQGKPPAPNSATTPRPSPKLSFSFPQKSTLAPTSKPSRKLEPLNPRLLKGAPASHEQRYKLLKLHHAELARLNSELKKDPDAVKRKLILSDQELIWIALDEEQKAATDKPLVYSNVYKHVIMKYKRMTVPKWKAERLEKTHDADAKSQSDKKKDEPLATIETGLTPKLEVQILSRLLTPIQELAAFNYVPVVPSDADIEKARLAEEASKGWEVCDRCQKRFQVFPGRREEDGQLASGGKCTYHSGKMYWPERAPGATTQNKKRYRCCGQELGDSAGCTTCENHVFKTTDPKRLALVLNFARTPQNPLAPTDRAVAFDCEMGYTVKGLELIRLTATSWPDGELLLDVLVQPIGEILDLNSRYSGVWPEDLVNAEPWSAGFKATDPSDPGAKRKLAMVSSPVVARDLFFSLISHDTPLIGHALENDLNSVRVVHPKLIDTTLLYPHKRGLPIRHGLKMLMETQLNRQIQVETAGDIRGHDSAEDARAAGDLVRLKVKEEWSKMKMQGWRVVDGDVRPPFGLANSTGALTEEFLERQAGA